MSLSLATAGARRTTRSVVTKRLFVFFFIFIFFLSVITPLLQAHDRRCELITAEHFAPRQEGHS